MNKLFKESLAEAIGTFALVFICCLTAMVSRSSTDIAITFGLVLFFLVLIIGPISGCHVNPAVTFAFWLGKKKELKDSLFYVLAQFIGAIVAGLLLLAIGALASKEQVAGNLGSNFLPVFTPFVRGIFVALIVEIILTTIFVFIVLFAVSRRKGEIQTAGIIGGGLFFVHLIGIYYTGTSVNPARSFGPAVFSWILSEDHNFIQNYWVFLVGPMIGAFLAFLLHKLFIKIKDYQ